MAVVARHLDVRRFDIHGGKIALDNKDFDRWMLALGQIVNRKGAGRLLTGLGLAAAASLGVSSKLTEAKRHRKPNKRKQRQKGQNRPNSGRGPGRSVAATGPAVTPVFHEGNINACPNDGKGFGVDPPKSGFTVVTTPCGECKISYTVSADKKFLSWAVVSGTCKALTVYVKGGPNYNEYAYGPGGSSGDSGLRAPDNGGENIPDISHFLFCGFKCPCTGSCEGKCAGEDDGCGTPCGNPCNPCQTCAAGICSNVACAGENQPCGCGCCGDLECVAGYCEEVCENPTSCDPHAQPGDSYYRPCCPGTSCQEKNYRFQCVADS